jgi:acyl-CoA hydrolase
VKPAYLTAAEAISTVKSGDRVFIQGSAATPLSLTRALAARAAALKQVELVAISTFGDMGLPLADYPDSFYINSLFVSANVRDAVNGDQGDYIPVFLSEISRLFDRGILPLDVALVHVSPPDKHGYCSLGVSVDVARCAVKNAKYVIAQVNPNMPRTHGDGMVHIRELHALVSCEDSLPECSYAEKVSEVDRKIGKNVAALIEDGATLQMGIGSVPDAVLHELSGHRDLGIHTEMFSDGVVALLQRGVITNRFKNKHRNKTIASFAFGSKWLYDFIDDNPGFTFLEADYVNNPEVIRKNPKVVAINSAIEVDLTGQVCADSIGIMQYSGVGGQMDFMRGAALSEGGKPIIAMPSTTHQGASRIVPFLKQGAGVVTTRAHVHYVVTEYGTAYLFGKNLKQRAYALLDIAHPNHRNSLEQEIFARFGKP